MSYHENLLSVEETAELLNRPKRTIRKWAGKGDLPSTMTATGFKFSLEDVETTGMYLDRTRPRYPSRTKHELSGAERVRKELAAQRERVKTALYGSGQKSPEPVVELPSLSCPQISEETLAVIGEVLEAVTLLADLVWHLKSYCGPAKRAAGVVAGLATSLSPDDQYDLRADLVLVGEFIERFVYVLDFLNERDAEPPTGDASEDSAPAIGVQRTIPVLRDYLAGGTKFREDVIRHVQQELGVSESTVDRARKALGVHARRNGYQGKAEWSLPGGDAQ